MKRYDHRAKKLFLAEFISLLGTVAYVYYEINNLRILELSLCTADLLAESITHNVYVSMTVWLCVLFFYEEFINCFMSEQFVIRYTAKWKLYMRQVCRILSGGIGITGMSFLNFFIATGLMGLKVYTWDRADSLFAFLTHICLQENQNVVCIFLVLFVNALLLFLYFLLVTLVMRWLLSEKPKVLLLIVLVFMAEMRKKGFMLTRVNVFVMFQTGEFNGVCLWQMFGIVILVIAVGWLVSIGKEFYNEKK
ncbi:MAG: hypothetical protein NC086_10795 [Alistipes sp.]|nr:hypothetical protein [Alistipes sp.]